MKRCLHHICWLVLTAVLLLAAACSDDATSPQTPTAGHVPLTFGVSVEQPTTRAGSSGIINNAVLASAGYQFGVFAYGISSNNGGNWTNQKLSYVGVTPAVDVDDVHLHAGNWSYGKEIDWGDQTISFLAYAPYVSDDFSGAGITGVSGSSVDDTTIEYTIGTKPSECVDLLWAVDETTGLPWLNTTVQQTGGPVTLSFHHALAAIGFHVQAMVDMTNDLDNLGDESAVTDVLKPGGKYKITIESLTLSPVDPATFPKKNKLNLNSLRDANKHPIARWEGATGTVASLTVPNDEITDALRHPTSGTVDALLSNTGVPGVTQKAQQLLIAKQGGVDNERCFFVFPHEKASYQVTLYWVISGTAPTGTPVQYERASVIDISDLELKAGIKYYLNFVIGLKTVRLDVTAEDWKGNPQSLTVDIEHGTSANSSLAPRRSASSRGE